MSQVNDDVTASLTDLSAAIEQNADDEKLLARRIRGLADAHAAGASWATALADEPSPGALTLSARILGRFSTASGALRRAVAIALRREGMTVPAIASAFGVTHQRVSVLLNRSGSEPMDGARR